MGLILCMETATPVCSVALVKDGLVIAQRDSAAGNDHSATLTRFAAAVMQDAGLSFDKLNAVAVSMGPGSYTGLRIGVSAAKGYCYALGIPLIAIPTLQSMALGMRKLWNESANEDRRVLFCPMIDARRMEVFAALYDIHNNCVRQVEAEVIDSDSFSAFLAKNTVIFSGTGAQKTETMLGDHPGARFLTGFEHSAAHAATITEEKYIKKEFEDVAYFEPFYLKDFVAGKPRVKGLYS